MSSRVKIPQMVLILIAAPVAWMAVSISWLVVPQIVRTVVPAVVEAVASSL